jgi:predicted nuclease of predicted toxin-antitoxin system
LIDENLSPLLAQALTAAGHDAGHVRDMGMASADDETILAQARQEDRVLVTADTDFGGLLAWSRARLPSVILLRRLQGRQAAKQASLLLDNIESIRDDLSSGCIAAFDDTRLRVRRLPI